MKRVRYIRDVEEKFIFVPDSKMTPEEIGRLGGKAGGRAVFEKYGKEYMARIGKRGALKRVKTMSREQWQAQCRKAARVRAASAQRDKSTGRFIRVK